MEMSEKEFEIFRAIRHGHCLRMLFPGLHKYGPLTATAKVRRHELKYSRLNLHKCNTGEDLQSEKKAILDRLARLLRGKDLRKLPKVSFYTNPMGHAIRIDGDDMKKYLEQLKHPAAHYIQDHMHRDLGGDYILAP